MELPKPNTKSTPTTETWNGSSGHVSDIDQVVSQEELIHYLEESFDCEVNMMQTKVYVNTVVMAKFNVPEIDKVRPSLVDVDGHWRMLWIYARR
jgi:hypothetical protein